MKKIPSVPADWWKGAFEKTYISAYKKTHSDKTTKKEVEFMVNKMKLAPASSILDVGCGYGRHAIPLAKKGYRVTGVDFSKTMLSEARKNAKRAGVFIEFLQQDCRKLDVPETTFDAALCMFTTFGYFHNEQDHVLFLQRIAAHLKPQGLFLLDVKNIYNAKKIKEACSQPNIIQRYNAKTCRWTMDRLVGAKHLTSSVRLFTLAEIKKMLTASKFTFQAAFGDFMGNPYTRKSNRLIVLAKKKKTGNRQ